MSKMLSLDGVSLRALEPEDLDFLYEWESEADAWHSSNTVSPYSRQLLWSYLESYDGDIYKSRAVRMMITLEGKSVGAVDIFDFEAHNRRAEVGIFVTKEHRCKGVANRALQIVKNYTKNRLGLNQIYATVISTNVAAIKTFEKSGFSKSAELKGWFFTGEGYCDALLLQCML